MLATENITNVEMIQCLASDPKYSVHLSASAGTGKTKVLTDRYLRLMLNGVSPKNILCLTYTNAAANEMLKRIKLKLKNWSHMNDQELNDDLFALEREAIHEELMDKARNLYNIFYDEYDSLKIQTIHSFCLSILKKYTLDDINYDRFNIIDQKTKSSFLSGAFNQMMTIIDNTTISAFDVLTDYYEIERIEDIISNTLNIKFLNFVSSKLDIGIDEYISKSFNVDCNLDDSNQQIIDSSLNIKRLVDTLVLEEESIGYFLKSWFECDHFKERNIKNYIDIFIKSDGDARQKLTKVSFIKKYIKEYELLLKEQESVLDILEKQKNLICAKVNKAILVLTTRLNQIYNQMKHDAHYFDYDDLIIKTVDILKNSTQKTWILYELDMAIDHILIDESQDLSDFQWDLIELLTEEFFVGMGSNNQDRTVFFVGDSKQSIYSFQGANVERFESIKSHYYKQTKAVNRIWLELDMNTSFRSNQFILNLIDNVFAKNWNIKHTASRQNKGNIEIWPLVSDQKSEPDLWCINPMLNKKQLLAKQIATKIDMWLSGNRVINSLNRSVEPHDIMILLRKRGEFANYLSHELNKLNIDVADSNSSRFKDSLVGMDMISLVRFLCIKSDDYNLACLLKSPFVNLSEDDLFDLSYDRPSTLWHSLKLKQPHIFNYLSSIYQCSKSMSIYKLFHKILYQDRKLDNFINRLGSNCYAFIDYFLESIIKFEVTVSGHYHKFYDWLCNLDDDKNLDLNSSKIKILTIHAAKGLESPIIILADSATSEQSPHENAHFDEKGNFYWSVYSDLDCRLLKSIRQLNKTSHDRENLNLLYVALTRARDELYICGWQNNKAQDSWYNLINSHHQTC